MPVEDFITGLYKDKAKMNAFKMDANNIWFWIKVFAVRYYSQVGESDGIACKWRDIINDNEDYVSEIQIQMTDQSESFDKKLFTIIKHLSTHTVTVQGMYYEEWFDEEFPLLKYLVYQLSEIQEEDNSAESTEKENTEDVNSTQSTGHADYDISDDDETHLKKLFISDDDDDETNPKTLFTRNDSLLNDTDIVYGNVSTCTKQKYPAIQ